MSDDKSKDYDFDADDPFMDNPLEKGAAGSGALDEADFDDLNFDEENLDQTSGKTGKTGENSEAENPSAKKKLSMADLGIMGMLKEYYLYLIGGVVALVIIYYMYGMIFPSTPSEPVRQAPAQQQSGFGLSTQPVQFPPKSVEKVQAPMAPAQVVQTPGPTTLAFTQNDLKQMIDGFRGIVNESNDKLASQLTAQLGQIETAQVKLIQEETALTTAQAQDLNELNTQVHTLNQAIAQSNKSMSDIAQALLRTQSQLKLLLAEKAQSRDQLVLRAVVPGRAWLVDAAGKTLSVAVGDEISDYGKVEQIDDKTATVIMSSGYVFN